MKASGYFLVPGLLLTLTIGLGIWLSRLGKPYNALLFNAHKLLALAAVVFAVVKLLRKWKTIEIPSAVVLLLILTALAVVILFATGALLSLNILNQKVLLIIHRTATAVVLAASTLFIHLLKGAGPRI